ncbi:MULTISPECIES: arsenate reductase (glutaredoxin) [Pontibacter]|uniref:Arsenate reductase n=1 Tax=Pontibacter lucknowensis TaxID=1077936 RepID=A0A1N7AM11_9BACT|nr:MULTISPECIES: arsenate reductase (glutaredoxin) [Pontibacter]EJF08192.1 arsenate reductase [Pontibacter sp. BAB1700]SIR40043.1 arsenate reductase [Pontibacter lucknowensis]
MVTIYHNNRCSKSRQTLELLREKGEELQVVEYLKETPSAQELKAVLKKLGLKPEQVLRKGEQVYKEQYAGKSYTDEEWLQIMAENPILIERPIVVKGDKAAIGRPPEKVLEIL